MRGEWQQTPHTLDINFVLHYHHNFATTTTNTTFTTGTNITFATTIASTTTTATNTTTTITSTTSSTTTIFFVCPCFILSTVVLPHLPNVHAADHWNLDPHLRSSSAGLREINVRADGTFGKLNRQTVLFFLKVLECLFACCRTHVIMSYNVSSWTLPATYFSKKV